MIRLPDEGKFIVDHAAHALDDADVLLFRFQDGSLLDMQLQKRGALIGADAVCLAADIAAFRERLAERPACGMGDGGKHLVLIELVTNDARAHHGGLIVRALLVRPDHAHIVVLVRDILPDDGLCNFQRGENAEDAVIVAALAHGVAVRAGVNRGQRGIAPLQHRVEVCHVVREHLHAERFTAAHPLLAGGERLGREGEAGDAAVPRVAEPGKGLDLILHTFRTRHIHDYFSSREIFNI